ncbi:uncharacterized protein E5676_scaffold232G001250 [Cucumis melo var. makuwa]|uniref:Uncharacterized protein n=1 Tax=Cucumis melo var. makuwa TaxID=1194695 RepID=A0A5D3BF62_CUCMM|nr:uncharacterized protein E5676_scaffold232G001250 [Cucumis melo var. makuwa]
MVVRNGVIYSEDECEENDAQLEEEYETPVDDEYIEEGSSISRITRRLLNVKIKEEKIEDQRENLFHTRCLIKGSPCSLVIDNGSCTNVGVLLTLSIRVVPAWVSFGITTYLGLCGPTGRQSSMYIDMIRVIRRGPRIPIVLVLPPGEGKGRGKLASDKEGSVTCHMGTQFCFRVYEFNDMFPHEDAPTGLPPLRGIEHQIDFIPGATLPNMAAY